MKVPGVTGASVNLATEKAAVHALSTVPLSALKAAVGGDVLVVECDDPEALAGQVRERLGVAARVMEGALVLERERGHEFVPRLVEAFPGRIRSVTLRQPTLEDAFVHVTGRRFRVRGST